MITETTQEKGMDAEERAALEEELVSLNQDIEVLKLTLDIRNKRAKEVMQLLGISSSILPAELQERLTKLTETQAYNKTAEIAEKAFSKSVDVANEAKGRLVTTCSVIKNSDAYKNVETTVGSAFCTMKDAIVHSTYGHLPDDN